MHQNPPIKNHQPKTINQTKELSDRGHGIKSSRVGRQIPIDPPA